MQKVLDTLDKGASEQGMRNAIRRFQKQDSETASSHIPDDASMMKFRPKIPIVKKQHQIEDRITQKLYERLGFAVGADVKTLDDERTKELELVKVEMDK